MTKKRKSNGDLLTQAEAKLPAGLGYKIAADRLGLVYLMRPEVMLRLLVDFGNEGFDFSMSARLGKRAFWKAMNQKADKLAAVLKGKNPLYMATPWFTDPKQLRATLYNQMHRMAQDAPPGAAWRKDPIRSHARAFMAFFLELSEGGIEGQGRIPNEKLTAEHIRKYAGNFLGMDPAMMQLNLAIARKP